MHGYLSANIWPASYICQEKAQNKFLMLECQLFRLANEACGEPDRMHSLQKPVKEAVKSACRALAAMRRPCLGCRERVGLARLVRDEDVRAIDPPL